MTAALNLAILVATLGSGYSLAAGVEASAATAGLEFTEEEGIELLSQSFRQAAAEVGEAAYTQFLERAADSGLISRAGVREVIANSGRAGSVFWERAGAAGVGIVTSGAVTVASSQAGHTTVGDTSPP